MTHPTPYPTTYYLVHRWWPALYIGDTAEWGAIGRGIYEDRRDAQDAIVESFRDEMNPADLTTVNVRLFNDAGWRDVTEDILTAIGARLSVDTDAADFPDAFLAWADSDIQDAAAEQAEADRAVDERRYAMAGA
jgi:hypothetical protein